MENEKEGRQPGASHHRDRGHDGKRRRGGEAAHTAAAARRRAQRETENGLKALAGSWLWHVGSSSLTRDQTQARCIGSAVLATRPRGTCQDLC